MADIAEITRTYGGLEGRRVKAGTRFSIGKATQGLPVITQARFTQLRDAGLAREWANGAGAPVRQPGPVARQTVIQKPLNESRTARKARMKNAGAPTEPRPLVNPAHGGPTSGVKLASSSPEVQASVESNLALPLRGRRKSASSRSTTPGKSSPGPESSTPATAAGGVTIQDARNSPA